MTASELLSLCAAALSTGLALFVAARDRRPAANRAFIAGMLVLGAHQLLSSLGARALMAPESLKWHRLAWSVGALIPGIWLFFSLAYARANYWEFVRKWRWALGGALALPLILVTVWNDDLFLGAFLDESARWILPLGWAGYALFLFLLLYAVLILINLESTLRASTGTIRWQIKFMLLGLGALFATQIYTASQAILFSSVNTALSPVSGVALLVAGALIPVSLWRSRSHHVEVYFSRTLLYNSLTVLGVGIYLLAVGGLAKIVSSRGESESLPLAALVVFLALLALVTILLSGGIRQSFRRLVDRHLKRPQYDYRDVWTTFTTRTSSMLDTRSLCSAIAHLVSETLGVASVSIWVLDEGGDDLALGGSTALSERESQTLLESTGGGSQLIQLMRSKDTPADLGPPTSENSEESHPIDAGFRRAAQIRYCVRLMGGQELLGFLTLNDKVTKEPFSTEDLDLLKTIADQAASSLLNLELSERLLQAKEKEAFQTLSAFFVHDLKNLASRLSLTLQNLPLHYDNPAFRDDLLKVFSQSVQKIDAMCSRLSPLSKDLEVVRREADLNQLVTETLAELDGSMEAHVVQELKPVPAVSIDAEQIQKVLVNLVLNASEAIGQDGHIRVATRERNGWAELSVSDDGHGMSSEFVARDLFKPFHTTKKQGLGIGLFHSKRIVDAHQGRIDVETEEGKGTTFRVMLPRG